MLFKRIIKTLTVLTCAGALVAACSTPASLAYPGTLRITSKVWGYYQEYLTKQGGVRKDGTFLVALENDIGVGARYSYCPPAYDYCTSGGLNVANKLCVQDKLKCVLFARGSKIVVSYKIID
nr:hypothetical protein [uncultured Dongia sp.]